MSSPLVGTGHLARLVLRRDRLRLPLWLLGLGGVIAASALAVPPIYDTPQEVAAYASAVGSSPVSYLMSGRQEAVDTIGGIVANEISQVAQLGTCLMVLFLVVRHTRAEEESGRAELVRSTVLGRHAATLTGLLYGAAAALAVGAITTGAMLAAGLEALGSATYGAGLTLLGLCYVAVSLVAVQLATSARGALGLAGAAVAVGYAVRGVGAVQGSGLVWASPFGWAQELDAFGTERWWPALPLVSLTAALLALAGWLTAHRDFGSGVLPARPGPARAARSLGTPVGLVLRLQRGLLLGWALGLTALGMLYGAIVPTIPELVASNPDLAVAIGAPADAEQAVVEAFLGYAFSFLAVLSTGFVIASVLRLRSEEESGRSEALLATRVRRSGWLGAVALVAASGALALSVLMGAGVALGYGLTTGEWDEATAHVGAQLGYLPGVLLVAAVAVLVAAVLPRRSVLAWAAGAVVVLQLLLSEPLRLPGWVDALSPFTHLARLPVEPFDATPVVVQLVLAAALVGIGLWGYSRRDVSAG